MKWKSVASRGLSVLLTRLKKITNIDMQDFHKALIYMNQHWLADQKKLFVKKACMIMHGP